MKVAIILGGIPPRLNFIKNKLEKGDKIICADRGANLLTKLASFRANSVVGDWDSISAHTKRQLAKDKVPLKFKKSQNITDGEFALDIALKLKPDEVLVFGAFGRHDHEHANIAILEKYSDTDIRLLDEEKEIFLASEKRKRYKIIGKRGDIMSLLPISKEVKLSVDGLKWRPKKGILYRERSTGISNVMTEDKAQLQIKSGILKVVHFWSKK